MISFKSDVTEKHGTKRVEVDFTNIIYAAFTFLKPFLVANNFRTFRRTAFEKKFTYKRKYCTEIVGIESCGKSVGEINPLSGIIAENAEKVRLNWM